MKDLLIFSLLVIVTLSCKGQAAERSVGGPCEDCIAALDYKVLNINPSSTDTLVGYFDNEPKIKITGTVYLSDGKTPARNILLYVYHTNSAGIYEPSANATGWENRHGQFRGWMKTNESGKYTFYTFRPGAYPNGIEPQHIHIYVKEPDTTPYYMDSYIFKDDPSLTKKEIESAKNRGGSGLLELVEKDGILTANRDLILGLNIPNYF